MQNHSVFRALEYQTTSWLGSSCCSTAAPFMSLWESAFQALSNLGPEDIFRTEGKEEISLPTKTKSLEEEHGIKAVDILGV